MHKALLAELSGGKKSGPLRVKPKLYGDVNEKLGEEHYDYENFTDLSEGVYG
jgi:hypothetical protein